MEKLKLFTCRLILIDFFSPLTENKHCYYLEGRKVASMPDGGGTNWVVMMASDAESSLHAHCGALEFWKESRGSH